MKQKVTFIALLLFIANIACAATFEVDGIYYQVSNADNFTVELAAHPSKYKGSVQIPETIQHGGQTYTVNSIAGSAFGACGELTSVVIPNTVETIYDWAFGDCTALETVSMSTNLTTMGKYTFQNCSTLEVINLPSTLNAIDEKVFENCKSLGKVIIPNSVEWIGANTFAGCDELSSVTIGSNVSSIATWAFGDCPKLSTVTCLATVPPAVSWSFDNDKTGKTLFVPKGTVSSYQNATGEGNDWNQFTTVKEIVTTGLDAVKNTMFIRKGDVLIFDQTQLVQVYDATGILVFSGIAKQYELPMRQGIYILKTEQETHKVVK